MDCPTCRLTNPADALHCDCGYDFTTNAASETPGWAIDLAWRQKLAAFWAISWPAAFISIMLMFSLISSYSLDELNSRMPFIWLVQVLVFFIIQSLLAHRLVRKNFRSFRVFVVRSGDEQGRRLSIREGFSVWLRIFWPQIALWAVAALVAAILQLEPNETRAIETLTKWLWALAIGPISIGHAVRSKYRGFRLQAWGFRYI